MKELEYPFDAELLLKKKIRLKKMLLADGTERLGKKIAILGGSTTNEIKNILELFLLNVGIKPSFYESEYNKFYEDGMFDNPELMAFSPDVIYIHTSNRNIYEWPEPSDDEETVSAKLSSVFDKFSGLWRHLDEQYHCPIIQNNFELPFFRLLGNQDARLSRGRVHFVTALNEMFYQYANSHEDFYIHDILYEASCYGLDKWSDVSYWHMYKYAMCVPAIPYTAYGVYLIIKSIFGKNKKVLALDLDNTLWGGIIGDDGAENIEIGQETAVAQTYSEFQSYVKALKQTGTLLSVISKNEDTTARRGFERPDTVLVLDDFVSFKANWEPKNINLTSAAAELNLLPDAFVFVDDNPAERAIVADSIPGTAVPDIGRPEDYLRIIDRAGYFEVTKLSEDDLKRNEMYAANSKRNQAQSTFADYGEYLRSLEMVGEIKPFSPEYYSRIAQLTNKSNQFNLTTGRYTQKEIENAANDERYITLCGKLSDRFGDNGVVSVVIGEVRERELHIILWLMSCRVLKRDMEFAMMNELVRLSCKRKIEKLIGYYYPTQKNGMVRDFYALQGFTKVSESEDGRSVFELSVKNGYENKNKYIKVNGDKK